MENQKQEGEHVMRHCEIEEPEVITVQKEEGRRGQQAVVQPNDDEAEQHREIEQQQEIETQQKVVLHQHDEDIELVCIPREC